MKKVINKKMYDTDTAELVAEYSYGRGWSDFRYIHEALYRTKKGQFFLFGEGGAASIYAEDIGGNQSTDGSKIIVYTPEDAYQWLEENEKTEAIEKYFSDKLEEA